MTENETTQVISSLATILKDAYGAPCMLGLTCTDDPDFLTRDCEFAKTGGAIRCWVFWALMTTQ